MSLSKIRKIFKQVGMKITLGHLGLLVISTFFLFGYFYLHYTQSLLAKDHEIIKSEFNEFTAIYNKRGIQGIKEFLSATETPMKNATDFFVRIEGADHKTKFFGTNGSKEVFNLAEIEHGLFDYATAKKKWVYVKTKRPEDDVEVLTTALENGDAFQVGMTVDDRDEILERFEALFAEVLLVALVLGGVGGFLLARRMLRPIRELNNTLDSLDKGDDRARVPISGNKDELDELSMHFNQMLDRINTSNQAMRHTLDIVAHELRTPLTSIRGHAEVTLQKKTFTEAEARQVMEDCVLGIDEILSEFKMMTDITEVESGLQNLKREEVNLESICRDIIDLYEIVAEQKNIHLQLNSPVPDTRLLLNVDRKKIRQAVANLIDNAIKYSPEDSTIELSYYKHNREAVIRIKDQGIGIDPEELPHIWKRLFRGENSRTEKGIGLGLSLVKSIIEAHNGSVGVETSEGKGSTFIIRLPL